MDEILMLQDEISALQACFSQELQLDEDSLEADAGDQLALQSTLTVLGERMATIHMKASWKAPTFGGDHGIIACREMETADK